MNNFFTSGWEIGDSTDALKSRYQMINIALILSSFAFIYGICINIINHIPGFVLLESILLVMNLIMFFTLRKFKNSFEYVAMIITVQCTFLMLFIVYNSEPDSMKFTWLFTYPIVLLYFQKRNKGIYWFIFMLTMLLAAPLQNFIEIQYSLFQIIYMVIVLAVESVIVFFYQIKMNEARDLILEQQNMLLDFNATLEKEVQDKTSELRNLNASLEEKVQNKIEMLLHKDQILTLQSKQAVMGEMITMIAHQWRQPLSTITLQISNIQLKKLLGTEVNIEEMDKVLSGISDTIMYLSETIDDFQTYFHPDKEYSEIEIHSLLKKAVGFTLPRLTNNSIEIIIQQSHDIVVETYINELIQVVINLINNALDILLELGRENSMVILRVEEEENKILISVEDNANGINEKDIPYIFEPYFSTKGKNGTGLGLYMSQMIIQKQFNGEINLKTSNEGSTFTIKIPKNIA